MSEESTSVVVSTEDVARFTHHLETIVSNGHKFSRILAEEADSASDDFLDEARRRVRLGDLAGEVEVSDLFLVVGGSEWHFSGHSEVLRIVVENMAFDAADRVGDAITEPSWDAVQEAKKRLVEVEDWLRPFDELNPEENAVAA